MIVVEEAKRIIDENIKQVGKTETVSITESCGRTLALDVTADLPQPPFDRVTMDGYAVISSDGPGEYEVIEYVPGARLLAGER